MTDVGTGRRGKAESVDASASRGVWLTAEDRAVSETNDRERRRRGDFVCSRSDPGMPSTTSDAERSRRYRKCRACVKGFLTFLFSTVGLTCLLIGYCIVGALVFMELESDVVHEREPEERVFLELEAARENRTADEMERLRREHVALLWEMTTRMNVLHPDVWMAEADNILKNYTTVVYTYTKVLGWDAGGKEEESQWSFAGSLLYAITVITTIGYGHIAPKTTWGQVVTIVYAIFGIPLTLLTITNLGGFMATAFRFIYRNICCTLCCVCCRRPQPPRQTENDLETGTGNRNPPGIDGEQEVKRVTWWSSVRQSLTNTDDIRSVRVPITVSLMLIGGYLAVGALLFTLWENDWSYLVGFYFCFITLSTIGFGDYVPGTSLDAWASQAKLVICALYLLVGLALIAMCFDLMQEQARSQFRELGRRLRLIDSQ